MRILTVLIFLIVSCGTPVELYPIQDPPIDCDYPETVTVPVPTQTEDLLVWLEFAQHAQGKDQRAQFLLEDLTVGATLLTPILSQGESYGPLTFTELTTDGSWIISYCLNKR